MAASVLNKYLSFPIYTGSYGCGCVVESYNVSAAVMMRRLNKVADYLISKCII